MFRVEERRSVEVQEEREREREQLGNIERLYI